MVAGTMDGNGAAARHRPEFLLMLDTEPSSIGLAAEKVGVEARVGMVGSYTPRKEVPPPHHPRRSSLGRQQRSHRKGVRRMETSRSFDSLPRAADRAAARLIISDCPRHAAR